jgi:hypothetical protein
MLQGARVLARVLVRRGIAAEGGSAPLAGAQMHPPGPDLDAFLAPPGLGWRHRLDLVDVSAGHWLIVPTYGSNAKGRRKATNRQTKDR